MNGKNDTLALLNDNDRRRLIPLRVVGLLSNLLRMRVSSCSVLIDPQRAGCSVRVKSRQERPLLPSSPREASPTPRTETRTHLPPGNILHNLLLTRQSSLLPPVDVTVTLGEQQRDEVDARPRLLALQLPRDDESGGVSVQLPSMPLSSYVQLAPLQAPSAGPIPSRKTPASASVGRGRVRKGKLTSSRGYRDRHARNRKRRWQSRRQRRRHLQDPW
jgi:hypothetical protein